MLRCAVEPERVGRAGEQAGEGALRVQRTAHRPRDELQARATRCSPRGALAVGPSAAAGRHLDEVAQQPLAPLGVDRLGMELHAPLRAAAVAQRHHGARACPGDHLELVGERLVHDQRVVADCEKALRDARGRGRRSRGGSAAPAVHRRRRRADDPAACEREPLVAEADPEHRQLAPDRARRGRGRSRAGGRAVPAPAEITQRSKRPTSICDQRASSLRTTTGSLPSISASSWKRL